MRVPREWLDVAPLVAAFVLLVSVLRGFWARVAHPYDLEWMEGGMLAHAWRLVHGLPLYPEPGPDWVPYVYPPGYPALLALLSPVFGLDYGLGRAVSVGSTLAICAALATAMGRRGSWPVGIAVAACWLGCWRAAGGFYDLVRPDALGTALLAWSIVFALERWRWAPVVSGLLLALGFTVKHHSAAFGFPIVLIFLLRDGLRPAVRFAVASAVPAGLFTLVMQLATEGRFLTYLLAVPASHPMDVDRMWPGTPGELGHWLVPGMLLGTAWLLAETSTHRSAVPAPALFALPSLFGLALAALAAYNPEVRGVEMPPTPVLALSAACIGAGFGAGLTMLLTLGMAGAHPPPVRWWGPFLLGAVALGVATLMRGHYGGFLNVLIPAHLAICLGFGWAVLGLRQAFPGPPMTAVTAGALLLSIVWIGVRLEVDAIVPSQADREAGDEVVARLAQCPPGPIFSPYAAWMPVQAGREPSAHLIALWDLDHARGPWKDAKAKLQDAARSHHWSCVLHGGRQPTAFGIEQNYRVDTKLSLPSRALMPKTGWRVRPESVLVPR
jgi:hypothetical protein